MAVTSSGVKTSDGREIVHVRKSRKAVRGKDRKGIRAADLMKALTDPVEGMTTSPMTEKPRVLVETMRVVGEDVMTAHDTAIYERLLAHARDQGIDRDSHEIAIGALVKYLEIKNVDRIVEGLERITRTVVRYDIQDDEVRRRGAIPLILAEVAEDLRSGTATLTYAIPGPIRRVVLAARDYAWLEIDAFARFKSRYAGRLYQRLALRAGYDEQLRKPWEIAPAQLAHELGYPLEKDGTLHYASFIRRCLEPAMKDIAEHVGRFSASWEVGKRGEGRGRPVETLTFRMSGVRKRFQEHRAACLSSQGLAESRAPDSEHGDAMPGMLAIGKAMTLTGLDEFTLIRGWKAIIKEAKETPQGWVGGLEVQGAFLMSALRKDGVGAAFAMWAQMLSDAKKSSDAAPVPVETAKRSPLPLPPLPRAPVPVKPSAQASVMPAKPEEKTASLEHCKQIILPADCEMSDASINDTLGMSVRIHRYTGDKKIKISWQKWSNGSVADIGWYPVSLADIDALQKKCRRYLDGKIEYVYAQPQPETQSVDALVDDCPF